MRRSFSSSSTRGVVGEERRDDDLGEARLAAVGLVERAEADEPVHAALGLEDPVRVLALDREGRRLQPGLLPRRGLDQLGLEPAVGGPALVHAQEHLGPVLGVGAALPGMDRDDRVAGVVLAVEERRLLEPVELASDRHERGGDLVAHLRVELVQLAGVVEVARERRVALEAAREPRVVGGGLRGAGLVVPETRLAHGGLELPYAAFERSGVKGTHEPSRAGPRAPSAARRS